MEDGSAHFFDAGGRRDICRTGIHREASLHVAVPPRAAPESVPSS